MNSFAAALKLFLDFITFQECDLNEFNYVQPKGEANEEVKPHVTHLIPLIIQFACTQGVVYCVLIMVNISITN